MNVTPFPQELQTLPVHSILPTLQSLWEGGSNRFVIQAEPGAGKSTGVPAFLLSNCICEGVILMLEPRRMAARSLAGYLSHLYQDKPGNLVGYRVRGESRCGKNTRLEIITEGVFVRMIQDDPELTGVSAVILDEFHERNLFTDLSYAFLLDVQENLRSDLRILIMSATAEKELLKKRFAHAEFLESHGRMFPVDLVYQSASDPMNRRVDNSAVSTVIQEALKERPGDVLVFLPGEGEIRRLESHLKDLSKLKDYRILPLYSRLSLNDQEKVFRQDGLRKIVLATSIAETSLTIPGITAVIDCGLERRPLFNRHSGLTRLETISISKASADQRMGRAGRVQEGICYRMWSEISHRRMDDFRDPEILTTDLSSLVLETALWGCTSEDGLNWLESPPKAHYHQARELLLMLQALNPEGRLTKTGRQMSTMGLHPRLAHLVLTGRVKKQEQTACCLAAILSERDWMGRTRDSDLHSRLYALKNGRDRNHPMVKNIYKVWESLLKARPSPEALKPEEAAELLLQAYPDRIAIRREGRSYHLSGGGSCRLSDTDSLQGSEFLLAVETGGAGRESLIFLSVPLSRDLINESCKNIISESEQVYWDEDKNRLKARKVRSIGHLILSETPLQKVRATASLEGLKGALRKKGLSMLPWKRNDQEFLNRCRFVGPDPEWPDFTEDALIESLENWFAPLLINGRLEGSLKDGLKSLLSWNQQTFLDKQVPERLLVPSGSHIRIDYSNPEQPALDVRIQELFGLSETPLIGGRVPLVIRLLNPARRPIQVTRDLKSFWENTYPQVRKELRGRYSKHYWPEDPYEAIPTRRVKPR